MIQQAAEKLLRSIDLTGEEMETAMEEIMSGHADTQQIVSFLAAMNKKGPVTAELIAAVSVMHRHADKVHIDKDVILDTCGTGGDKKGVFNVSTAVSFVAAGSGITVAKHGNRSVSSLSGSADILEALGVNINLSKDKIAACLNNVGIAFLFAPNFHPAMKYAMPARKQIKEKTIFNILGPLTNPAGATHQLVGVYDKRWTEILAGVLGKLGIRHALVVHGEDGLDEITTTDKTFISEVRQDQVKSYEVKPEDFGFKRSALKDLAGGSAYENAEILLAILKGERGHRRDIVLLNAGAAIYTADKTNSIAEGIKIAAQSLDSGKALEKLELLKEYSNR